MGKLKINQTSFGLFLLIIFSTLICNTQCECFGENCLLSLEPKKAEKYTLGELVQAIDKEIRRVYWYYLNAALQVFQSNVEVPSQKTIHIYIYRNKFGTYLAVVSMNKQTLESTITTFVRLGSGFAQDTVVIGLPLFLQPYIITLKLSPNELVLNKTVINQTKNQTAQTIKQQQKLAKIDKQIRTNYWFYLSQAFLINSSTLTTNERTYAILSFINITGTYLVIASIDNTNNVKVNTFIRLGAGSTTNQVKSIQMQPQVIALS